MSTGIACWHAGLGTALPTVVVASICGVGNQHSLFLTVLALPVSYRWLWLADQKRHWCLRQWVFTRLKQLGVIYAMQVPLAQDPHPLLTTFKGGECLSICTFITILASCFCRATALTRLSCCSKINKTPTNSFHAVVAWLCNYLLHLLPVDRVGYTTIHQYHLITIPSTNTLGWIATANGGVGFCLLVIWGKAARVQRPHGGSGALSWAFACHMVFVVVLIEWWRVQCGAVLGWGRALAWHELRTCGDWEESRNELLVGMG